MCEEEDLYFLYLERLEQACKAARGETASANPHWLWPAHPAAAAVQPATASKPRAEKPAFVCDAPG
jgi:hypothetical protein